MEVQWRGCGETSDRDRASHMAIESMEDFVGDVDTACVNHGAFPLERNILGGGRANVR